MSITLRQMRYFASAAETGKLSAAASACGVTQSAITLALKALEDQLGVALFERSASGVTLTLEGQNFLPKVLDILASVSDAARSVRRSPPADRRTASIAVGATEPVIGYFLVPHLSRFRRRFPGIDVAIRQMDQTGLEQALVERALDLAVILASDLQRPDALGSSIVAPSRRRLWLAAGHRLLARDTISLADVASEPYIMLTLDEAEQAALSYWTQTGHKPATVVRTNSVEAVRTLVSLGMGVTILSDIVFRPWSLEGSRIEVRELCDPIPSVDIRIAWRTTEALSPTAEAFRTFLCAAFAGRPHASKISS